MERFVGDRLESVDIFADSGENVGDTGYDQDEDMFDAEDDLELVKALEETGELLTEMEYEEEVSQTITIIIGNPSHPPDLSLPTSRHSSRNSAWV